MVDQLGRWMRLARPVLCVEWDRRSLRILAGRIQHKVFRLDDAHAFRIPTGTDIEDADALGALIAAKLAQTPIRRRRVSLDVPRDRAVINRLTMPPTPPEELAAAVRFQAMKELPFPLDEAEVDFVPLQRDAQQRTTEALLAGVRRETLEFQKRVCSAAGLSVERIGLRPYSTLRAARQLSGVSEDALLFVDVGPTQTEITVFRGGGVAFSRSASVSVPLLGGELATDDSRVSSRGDLDDMALREEFHSASIQELVVEVARTLQAYRVTESGAAVERIVVAGGTGVEPALAEAAERRFGLPARVFDPSSALGVSASEGVKLRSFAGLLGLALGHAHANDLEIDFLNPKRPAVKGASLRQRARVAGLAAAMVAVAVGGWVYNQFRALDREIEAMAELVDPQRGTLSKRAAEIAALEVKTLEARDWESESNAMVWLDHLLSVTQRAIEPGREMLASDMDFVGGPAAAITMKISASSSDVVTRFVENLNAEMVDGKPLYRASQGVWQEQASTDGKFVGRVDVRVELLRVREMNNPLKIKARETERKKALKV